MSEYSENDEIMTEDDEILADEVAEDEAAAAASGTPTS